MQEELNLICRKPECTFSQTGQCVLNHEALSCPDRLESITSLDDLIVNVTGNTVLTAPDEMERLSSSFSLTPRITQKLTRNRYCKVVSILGVPGTGKTASLVSLYLLLAHNKLDGYKFLDSKSVMAFEEISKGARRWNVGKLPEQLTTHTELQDERIAGYLHLRVIRIQDGRIMDLLLTDLPGEWTTSLIETNRFDRLDFLKSSDRIWLMVNAEEIENKSTRQYTIHRMSLLIDRIKTFLSGSIPDITLVVTHCDKTAKITDHLKPLQKLAVGFDIKVCEIASFSSNKDVLPGSGIPALIADIADMRSKTPHKYWPNSKVETDDRQMMQFQNY